MYTVKQAAEYLDMSIANVKYHVYKSGRLTGSLIGHTLVFSKDELDKFKKSRENNFK